MMVSSPRAASLADRSISITCRLAEAEEAGRKETAVLRIGKQTCVLGRNRTSAEETTTVREKHS